MQAAGCAALDDLTAQSAMLMKALRLAGRAWKLMREVSRNLSAQPANLGILVDSPALHLPMAKRLKSAGCPVLYYVAPQLWAWAPWRIGRLRRRVDRLAAILPFEEMYFQQRGVAVRYVGHPLIEQLGNHSPDRARVEAFRRLGQPVIACLPGSRSHVIREVLPGQIEVAQKIAARHKGAAFLFSAAGEQAAELIKEALAAVSLNACVEVGANAEIFAAADLTLCASGTATLEVAYHGVPMIGMYNGSNWGYRLVGRWFVWMPHLSLVNILAGRRVVPEFMPYYTSTDPIAAEALDLLGSEVRRNQMRLDLKAVIQSLGTDRAARQTAAMAMEMICEPEARARV